MLFRLETQVTQRELVSKFEAKCRNFHPIPVQISGGIGERLSQCFNLGSAQYCNSACCVGLGRERRKFWPR